MKYKYKINGLDCASCANELEEKFKKIDGVLSVVINFMTEKLILECAKEDKEEIEVKMKKIIKKEEPDTTIKEVVF